MYRSGQDVFVTFDGAEWPGEVEKIENGWVFARILIDPEWDFGRLSSKVSPIMTVAVRERFVRPAAQ